MNSEVEVDSFDAVILRTLLKEARTPFTEIAKDCGLSNTSIMNRFNLMVKAGIITGSVTQIYPKSLGYNCVALIRADINPKHKEEVRKYLGGNLHIAVHSPSITDRDSITGFAVAKNDDELSQVANQIRNNSYIRSVDTAIWIDRKNMDYPQNLVIGSIDESTIKDVSLSKRTYKNTPLEHESTEQKENEQTSKKPHELDNIDRSLIKILTKNARVPFREIAKSLCVSANNVIKRYKELRKTILPFSSITLNLKKIGYAGMGVFAIKVSNRTSVENAYDRIIKIPNIIVAIKVLGNFDILAITPFRTLENLANVTDEISAFVDIYRIETMIDETYTSWPLNIISDILIDKLQII